MFYPIMYIVLHGSVSRAEPITHFNNVKTVKLILKMFFRFAKLNT